MGINFFPGPLAAGLIIFLALFPVRPAESQNAPNALSPMGINLNSVSYWSPELVFTDLFKQSQPWKSQFKGKAYGRGGDLGLTSRGWLRGLLPGQTADSIIFRAGGHYPAGDYVCFYDGSGIIEFELDASVKNQSRGRISLRVAPSDDGIVLRIKETHPEDPIRNIRLIPAGFEMSYQQRPFRPDFLKRWSRFKVIRFMDWMRTNDSKIITWAQRPVPEMQTQGSKSGVALEYMLLLANTLGADPWFSMPHMASHDYIYNFALMVREKLDPHRRVYVEYTNEAWNGKFEQARYCSRVGQEMGLSRDPFKARLFFYVRRAVEVFKIWEKVFGGTDRLVRVLASQSANPWVSRQILNHENAWRYADALAVAPYFGQQIGSQQQKNAPALTLERVFRLCRQSIKKNRQLLLLHREEAAAHGLDLIAYEGGQHLAGRHGAENHKPLTYLFQKANRHPQMHSLYLHDLASWKKAGGTLFVTFSSMSRYCKWGCWGLLEHIDQDPGSAPKYRGVFEFMQKNPVWWRN